MTYHRLERISGGIAIAAATLFFLLGSVVAMAQQDDGKDCTSDCIKASSELCFDPARRQNVSALAQCRAQYDADAADCDNHQSIAYAQCIKHSTVVRTGWFGYRTTHLPPGTREKCRNSTNAAWQACRGQAM